MMMIDSVDDTRFAWVPQVIRTVVQSIGLRLGCFDLTFGHADLPAAPGAVLQIARSREAE